MEKRFTVPVPISEDVIYLRLDRRKAVCLSWALSAISSNVVGLIKDLNTGSWSGETAYQLREQVLQSSWKELPWSGDISRRNKPKPFKPSVRIYGRN